MCKHIRSSTIKAHITKQEREELDAQAKRLGMSASNYIRNVMINYRLPKGAINAAAIRDLYKVNADLARLGNLLKMAMNDNEFPVQSDPKLILSSLLERLEETQIQLKTKIEEL